VGCRDNITGGICRKPSGDGFEVPSLTDFRNRLSKLVPLSCAHRNGPDCFSLPSSANKSLRRSFDHLVGEREQLVRYGEAERLRSIEIYHQHVFCGELDRQVGRLLALKNAIDIARHDPILID
jgi:hypothetical protein